MASKPRTSTQAIKGTILTALVIAIIYVGLYKFKYPPPPWQDVLPTGKGSKHGLPRILMWTAFFKYWYGKLDDSRTGEDITHNCGVTCLVTNDRRLLSSSDVVVFHANNMNTEDFPLYRSRSQRWIFFTLEAPTYTRFENYSYIKDMFNWTMTYRSDSDVHVPYGRFVPRSTPAISRENLMAFWKSKRKAAVWMVSHCTTESRREAFFVQLQKHIEVDVYGDCGPYNCSKSNDSECYEEFERSYFYMLSFENSLCVDYVTEKLFKALKYGIIPIVFGGANYSKIAPPNSFIDALDFPSPKALAGHLLALSQNFSAYSSYFKWKVHQDVEQWDGGFCELCKKLYSSSKHHRHFSYGDIEDWWKNGGRCRRWGTEGMV